MAAKRFLGQERCEARCKASTLRSGRAAAVEDGLGERGNEPEGLFAPPKGGVFYAVVTERVLAHRLEGLKSDRVAISQIYTRLQRRHCNDHEKSQNRYGICKGKVPTFV